MLVNQSVNPQSLYSLTATSLSFLFILVSWSRLCFKPIPFSFQCPCSISCSVQGPFLPSFSIVSSFCEHAQPTLLSTHSLSVCSRPKFPGETGLSFPLSFSLLICSGTCSVALQSSAGSSFTDTDGPEPSSHLPVLTRGISWIVSLAFLVLANGTCREPVGGFWEIISSQKKATEEVKTHHQTFFPSSNMVL